ncbi:hypothetical protein AB0H43_26775 [Hamadaea sp. NPDC050747]|uniref:hypothetical protein n=1 Tax=Hamadaea sp. NPDC050747 TaxID=3155789 RepID=UPI003408A43C
MGERHDEAAAASRDKAGRRMEWDRRSLERHFAERFPDEWRRAGMIPGLRQQVVDALGRPVDTIERNMESMGCLLGHGRVMTDEQWRAWARAAFAQCSGG